MGSVAAELGSRLTRSATGGRIERARGGLSVFVLCVSWADCPVQLFLVVFLLVVVVACTIRLMMRMLLCEACVEVPARSEPKLRAAGGWRAETQSRWDLLIAMCSRMFGLA